MSLDQDSSADSSTTNGELDIMVDDDFQLSLRSFGVTVTMVRPELGGVVLEGVSRTFYGKQMAQELARKANLVVISNRIRVERVNYQ